MPRRALFSTTAILLAIASAPALAQPVATADAESAETTDTIIIQAARRDVPAEALPTTVRLLDREELIDQSLFSTNLFDIVGVRAPSLSPSRQKLSGVGESFRGREPLYLIDGVPQSNPLRNGSRDGFTIDPSVIERVEVLFGANAIQGVGATGGVINYVTLSPPTGEDWRVRLESQITASNDVDGDGTGYRGAGVFLRDFGAADVVVGLAAESRGAFYDAEGRRIGVDGTQGDIQDSVSTNVFFKGGWDLDPLTRLQATINLFELEGDGDYTQVAGDRTTGVPATSIRGDQEGEAPTNTVRTYALDFTREDVFGGDFSAQAFYREFEAVFGGGTFGGFFNTGDEPEGVDTFDQSANNSNKTGLKLTYTHSDLPVEGLTLTGGVDIIEDETFQELVQTGRLWVPETVFFSTAPFFQADYQFFDDRALISAGVRAEIGDISAGDFVTIFSSGSTPVSGGEQDFEETLFNIGATFEVVDGVTAYASFAEGFTVPDVGRVLRAVNEPGQDVDTLLDLEPIIADNLEVGVSLNRGGFTGNLSYFTSESDFGQRLAANEAGIFEVRREPTEIEGWEALLEYDTGAGYVIGANYAALEGQSDQDRDGAVDEDLNAENISPDRLNLYVIANPRPELFLRAQASTFLDRSFNDGDTVTDFDGYTVIDLSAGYAFGDLGRLDFGLQNALNEDYITYYSQSSPNAATRGNRFFAGRGRTFTLRWTAEY